MLTKYFQLNTWFVFLIIYIIYVLALIIELNFLFTDEFYFDVLSGQEKSGKDITDFINKDRAQNWINFPFAILIILIPTIGATIALSIGNILNSNKIALKNIFKITLKSHIVFAISYFIGILLKLIGLIEVTPASINDRFGYQSLLVFFEVKELPEWLLFPLQSLNISELVLVLMVAFGYSIISDLSYLKALGRVALYYILGLIFWVIVVIFVHITI